MTIEVTQEGRMLDNKVDNTVLSALKAAIEAGDKIPTLMELAAIAGTGKTAVSNSLSALEDLGLIQIIGNGVNRYVIDVETGKRTATRKILYESLRRKGEGISIDKERIYLSRLQRTNEDFVNKICELLYKMVRN